MINFENFTLANGLHVVVHEDPSSQIAVVNILYDVGARDEIPPKTGFAHLFEHLMFGGSQHIPSYDAPLQQVGGSNNAYTTSDITNYYCSLPAANLETAFWLESDRMLSLSFDPKVLEVQRKVVIEEFKERYLNQPYGDIWLELTKLAYTTHPYRWPTIGQAINHIEAVTMEDVRAFFSKFYAPNNAILVVAGKVTLKEAKRLSQKWFATIPAGVPYVRKLPQEPTQREPRKITLQRNVPLNAMYKGYHVPAKNTAGYYTTELLCSILGEGKSSKLYEQLVEQKQYFSALDIHTTEALDPGLLIIGGYLNDGITFQQGDEAIHTVLKEVKSTTTQEVLIKAKNQIEAHMVYEEVSLLNRAQDLALATLLGNTNLVNCSIDKFNKVTLDDIKREGTHILQENNCSTIYYEGGVV